MPRTSSRLPGPKIDRPGFEQTISEMKCMLALARDNVEQARKVLKHWLTQPRQRICLAYMTASGRLPYEVREQMFDDPVKICDLMDHYIEFIHKHIEAWDSAGIAATRYVTSDDPSRMNYAIRADEIASGPVPL